MASRRVVIVGLGDSTTAGTPAFRSPLEAPPHGAGNPESQYAYWMMRAHPEWTVLNTSIESIAKVLDIPFADTHVAVADPNALQRLRGSPDGLHPDVEGYRRMGEALTRTIEESSRRSRSR